MKIHEYQGKEILRKYNIPTPKGFVIEQLSQVKTLYEKLNAPIVVVKAQIHAGGRGKGGGVKLARSLPEAEKHASEILGMQLVTHQTGAGGKKVLKLLIEEGTEIQKEFYASITLDRSLAKPVLMVSTEGGMDIEEVAAKTPEKILKETIEPTLGLQPWQASRLAFDLGFNGDLMKQVRKFFMGIWQVYEKEDCSLLEINPMVQTKDSRILALDCKINFDDNAVFRHPDQADMRDISEEDPLEVEASKYNLNYIRLTGEIGCMVNGAGLAMATMDIIKYAGSSPANFLDVGGNANVETVTNGFKITLSDPNVKAILVNIFGGIVRCDRIANGIIEAAKKVEIKVPLVVRLAGTNSEQAKQILENSDISMIVANDLQEAARKVVEAVH